MMDMTENNDNNVILTVALVALLIVGSVMTFMITDLWKNITPDPHDYSSEYVVEGFCYGESCSGSGVLEYTPENSNYYLYQLSIECSSDNHSEELKLGLIFGLDENPLDSAYKYVGKETLDNVETTVWKYNEKSTEYTVYIGEACKLIAFKVASQNLDLSGTIA